MNLNLLKSRDSDSGFTDQRGSHESLAKPPSAAIGMMLSRRIVETRVHVCRWCRPVATMLVDARHSTAPSDSAPLSPPPRHQHPPLAASAALSSFDAYATPRRASAGLHCSNEVALSLPTSLVALADAS